MTNSEFFQRRCRDLREKLVWNRKEAEEYRRLSVFLEHANRIGKLIREAKHEPVKTSRSLLS